MTYFLTVHKNRRASSIKRMIIRRKQGREEKREMAASKSVINVAALCGSLRSASFNRGLIRYGPLFFFYSFSS